VARTAVRRFSKRDRHVQLQRRLPGLTVLLALLLGARKQLSRCLPTLVTNDEDVPALRVDGCASRRRISLHPISRFIAQTRSSSWFNILCRLALQRGGLIERRSGAAASPFHAGAMTRKRSHSHSRKGKAAQDWIAAKTRLTGCYFT
jgi:hypothetical protein